MPACAPALAIEVEGILYYTKAEHVNIYMSGMQPISEIAFNCTKTEGLRQFLKDVRDRADKMGWTEMDSQSHHP